MAYKIPSHFTPSRPQVHVLGALGNGTLIYNRNDYRMMPDGSQGHGTARTIERHSQVDLMKSQLLRRLAQAIQSKRGAKIIALDVGANIGLHTISMAAGTYPHGTVLAFEPQLWVYYCLCGNLAINNLHNAQAHLMALGDQKGRIKLKEPNHLKPASFGSFGLDPNWNMDVGQQDGDMVERVVPISRLDDLTTPRVDLIKLDIEGLEAKFILGGKEKLATHKPAMVIEYLKGDRKFLLNTLEENGYRYMRYSQEQDIIAWHKEDEDMHNIINSLLTEEPLETGFSPKMVTTKTNVPSSQQTSNEPNLTITQTPSENKK